jgi:hypothetical protein
MISLHLERPVQPRSLPQTATQPDREALVITFPGGWRAETGRKFVTAYAPAGGASARIEASQGFPTLDAFEQWNVAAANFIYRQAGDAILHVPYQETGLARRFSVNQLDIVIREYQDPGKHRYLGSASIRLRDVFVSVKYEARWDAVAENRAIFQKSITTLRWISKNLL